jgi:hypothetical protein
MPHQDYAAPAQWKLCCSNTSPEFMKFLVQVIFGAAICGFAMIMIATNKSGGNNEIYFSMLSGTVGLFLPHPTPGAGRETRVPLEVIATPQSLPLAEDPTDEGLHQSHEGDSRRL